MRLIDADALLDALDKSAIYGWSLQEDAAARRWAERVVELMPTAEPKNGNLVTAMKTRDKDPECIWGDIVCEIQRKAIDRGGGHVGDAVDWCIFGTELKNAIYELFGEDSQQ